MTAENPPFAIEDQYHSAQLFRLALGSLLPPGIGGLTGALGGVVNAGDLACSAGTGNSINVAEGQAWIPGTQGPYQGLYFAFNDATVNLPITPNGSEPMYVLITATVNDTTYPAGNPTLPGGSDQWGLLVTYGTPAATPLVPATPHNSLLLSTWLIPASASSSASYTSGDNREIISSGQWRPGDYKESASMASQAGWLYCDGTAYSRTTYAALFAAISTTYGPGDGSTTFNVPDRRGVVGVGVGSVGSNQAPSFTIGGVYGNGVLGEAVHTLSQAELAPHYHNVSGSGAGTTGGESATHIHSPGWNVLLDSPGSGWKLPAFTGTWGWSESGNMGPNNTDHNHGFTVGISGTTDDGVSVAGWGHNNLQPSMGVAVFVKT
jgi:microcystin-dependent protein